MILARAQVQEPLRDVPSLSDRRVLYHKNRGCFHCPFLPAGTAPACLAYGDQAQPFDPGLKLFNLQLPCVPGHSAVSPSRSEFATDCRSSPTSTFSSADRSPMIRRIGGGNSLIKVGVAMILSPDRDHGRDGVPEPLLLAPCFQRLGQAWCDVREESVRFTQGCDHRPQARHPAAEVGIASPPRRPRWLATCSALQ